MSSSYSLSSFQAEQRSKTEWSFGGYSVLRVTVVRQWRDTLRSVIRVTLDITRPRDVNGFPLAARGRRDAAKIAQSRDPGGSRNDREMFGLRTTPLKTRITTFLPVAHKHERPTDHHRYCNYNNYPLRGCGVDTGNCCYLTRLKKTSPVFACVARVIGQHPPTGKSEKQEK